MHSSVDSYSAEASPYDALDMAGNVLEWVADWFDGSYYASSLSHNPTDPDSDNFCVLSFVFSPRLDSGLLTVDL